MTRVRTSGAKAVAIVVRVLILASAVAGIIYAAFICDQPICRATSQILGFGTHRVTSFDEYMDYASGADLYVRHNVMMLSFDCEALREQAANYLNEWIRQEVMLSGAMHEGKILVLYNYRCLSPEDFDGWHREVVDAIGKAKGEPETDPGMAAVIRLFDTVRIETCHGLNALVDIDYRYQCP